MIENILFILFSLFFAMLLRKVAKVKSNKSIFLLNYLLMFIVGAQYYSIFLYGSTVKGEYPARIFLGEDFFVRILNLPSNIQWVGLIMVLFLAFFCHPIRKF